MANEDHLEILKKGVDEWNQWYFKNKYIYPDFSFAHLPNLNLYSVDLKNADLEGANLEGTYLKDANLSGANLSGVNLFRANLSGARLEGTNLENANLEGANLEGAKLFEANLENANLYKAKLQDSQLSGVKLNNVNLQFGNLQGTRLRKANLENANLEGANLEGAKLFEANLENANLSGANLQDAYLNHVNFREVKLYNTKFSGAKLLNTKLENANLYRAKLIGGNLSQADLRRKNLIRSVLDGCNLTGVKLWETQRAGWSIKNVICEYAYFDEEGEEKTEFAPGEFERLYSDKTKIVLHFKGGISPLEIATLPALIRHLEEQHERKISLQSVSDGAGGVTVILRIDDDDEIPFESRAKIRERLQASGQEIIAVQRERIALLEGQVEALKWTFNKVLETPKIQLLGGNMGDTYNNSGQAGAIGKNAMASNNQFIQNFGQQINLIELAKELGTMREKLKEEASSTEEFKALAQVSEAEDAAKANNPARVVSALKSGGGFLLDLAKRLGVSLAASAIEEAMKGK